MTQEKEPMVEVGIAWEKYNEGELFYSGYLMGKEFVIYKNARKTDQKHPDWKAYFKDKDNNFFDMLGFYEKQSKSGRPFWTGWLSKSLETVAFIQTSKKSPKAPDVKIYFKQRKERLKAEGDHNNIGSFPEPKAQNYNDDEMPF